MPFSGCWIVDPKTINDKQIYAYCKPLPHILSAWFWPHLIFFSLSLSLFIQWWSCCTGGTWSRVGLCLAVYCCCSSLWRSSVWSAWWLIWPWLPSPQPSASESTSLCCRLCRKQTRDIPSSKPAVCAQTVCVTQSVTNIVLLWMQSLSGGGDVTVPWSDAEVRRKRPVLYQQHTERTAQTVSGAGSGGLTKGDPLFNLIYTGVIRLADKFSLKWYLIGKYRTDVRW